jgi:hypothetical protein
MAAAITELLEPAVQETPAPAAPPLSSTPPPAPAPPREITPVPTLAPPPVRAPEVEAHASVPATPTADPLFTIKVWQLGFAVIVVMLAVLYALGIL